MIVSRRWLADYVDVDMPLDDLTDRLTKSGLNLEGVEEVTLPSGETDVAIDLEVTSNRPDCLGHVGVAREIATLYGTELRGPDCDPPVSGTAVDGLISVEIEDGDLCPRYVARVIRGVKVGPTPAWLQDRLRAIDANYTPVNNVVDATNYVMFETGQPFHAFDLAKVAGPKIVVRRAAAGEQIEAINHETYELKPSFGVIADAERPVAIAGVMGGAGSEITEGTTDVLLEAAAFGPLDVRNAARSLKLFSPSQYRFERLTDVVRLDLHSRRCAKLILDLAGGELLAGAVDVDVRDDMDAGPITLRTEKVEQLLGTPATRAQIDAVFAPLGIAKHGGDAYLPPSWRPDLTREVDLIEEFARVVGYDELDDNATLPVAVATVPKAMRVVDRLRDTLFGYGFSESVTLSFVTADESALFDPPGAGASPLSVEHSSRKVENVLRRSLVPSLLACRRDNERAGTFEADLFEVARVFLADSPGDPAAEPQKLTLVKGGAFGELKGVVEAVVAKLAPAAVLTAEPTTFGGFVPGRGATLALDGKPFGLLGEVADAVRDAPQLGLRDEVCVAELDLAPLVAATVLKPSFTPIPEFPAIERDLNFVLDEAVSWADLSAAAQDAAGPLCESVAFVDQFRGSQLGAGKKSYVLRLSFRAADRTLTGEKVDTAVRPVIAACEKSCGATLRG